MRDRFNTIKELLFNNKSARQTIVKNTFWLGFGTALNKILSLVLIVYAARVLGAEEYGKFAFALAFIYLFVVFFDFGLSPIITREFAREKEKREDFYSIISLKVLLALGTLALILLGSFLTVPEKDIQSMILILSLFLIANSFWGMFNSFFHARQKMEYEALFDFLQVLMIFGLGLFILFNYPSSENLSYAYFLSASVTLVFVSIFFHFKIFPLKINFNLSVWKKFLTMSWPLALIGLFGVIYGYIDSVMLGYWKMFAETGWYNAAQRIVMAGLIPMGFIGASFYPALSKFSIESREKFQKAWDAEMEIMILLAFPLMVGGMVLAPQIIHAFYPLEFTPSILALQILVLTLGPIFLYRPFYDAMIVLNQQTKTFWITVFGALANVVLNLLLIPKYSLYGAAIATVTTNALVLGLVVFYAVRFTFLRVPFLRTSLTFLAAGAGSGLMYLAIKQPLVYNLNVFISVLAGAAVYFIVIFAIKKYVLAYVQK